MLEDTFFLGIDCSTTAAKVIAWDRFGEARAEGRAPISLENKGPDAWEQDASTFLTATFAASRACLAALGEAKTKKVCAICVTHQRETFVVTDPKGEPLHPALVWMDTRCRKEVAEIAAKHGASRLHQISGKYPCTTPSLYKLVYLLRRGARHLASADVRVLDVHALLAYRLTGRLVTSVASADPMGLIDMAARDWSDEILSLAGLSRKNVPELAEPGEVMGFVTAEAARELGVLSGIPVVAGAGDGQAAALGAGITGPSACYLNLGTAIVSGVVSPKYRIDQAFRTMMAANPGAFLYETDLKGGTFTLSWLATRLCGASESDVSRVLGALERESEGIGPGAGGLVAVPYWNGVMNPYWDDDAAGLFVGLTGEHGAAHLYRAIVEGLALEQRLHTEGVERAAGAIDEMRIMGGGSRSELFCKILADVLGKPIVRAGTSEATSLGAGILAAVGAGVYPSVEEAAKVMTSRGGTFVPGEGRAFYDALYRDVYVGLYPALAGALGRLTALKNKTASLATMDRTPFEENQ